MSIAFGSINTGLPKDIVKKIMEAERIPIQQMQQRKGKIANKEKLVGELIGLMQNMRGEVLKNASARSLKELSVDTNDEIVQVSADKNVATPGSYQFEVVQLAQKGSAMSSGVENADDIYLGVGYIQYYLPDGDSKEIYIDSDNSSLNGIAKLINKNKESGLRASVINDGSGSESPWRLLMSLKETGDEKKVDFPYFYLVDGEDDLVLEFERKAQDAVIKLDGFEVEVPANKVTELIPGVSIDLKKAKPGEEFSINVKENNVKITEKITSLVDKLNGVLGFIKQQNTLDQNSDTTSTLGGDFILQSIESKLRGVIFKNIETEYGPGRLGDLGITFQKDGLLGFDAQKFEGQINKNSDYVTQVLTGHFPRDPDRPGFKNPGFIDNLGKFAKESLQFPTGILQSRKSSIKTKIAQMDNRISQRERILGQKETNLKNRFSRLEETISKIRGQGAGVASLGGGGANPVTQLG